MDANSKYKIWLKNSTNKQILAELKAMNKNDIESAFFKDIEFGTAGLRGIVGAGSNCMNIYTVGRVAESIAIYMKNKDFKSVAISYDSRIKSLDFAKLSARIFAYYGIKVYFADQMLATPFLSYMVRYYHADIGVMITASHNPKDYNGYKVYSSDGCQLLDEPCFEIMKIAENVSLFERNMISFAEAQKLGLIEFTDLTIKNSYSAVVEAQSLNKIKNITAVYTSLNGVGMNTIPRVLVEMGATLIFNKIQCKPNKNFTTCPYPNPERDDVYPTSIKLANAHNADLILASDPDADRIGVCVKHNNEFVHLTGNEIGVLLIDYLLSNNKNPNGYIVKSVVSTELATELAKKYGVKIKNVLTGFRFIGNFITNLEKDGKENEFIFGFEESSGYLAGTFVRDKDATVASMLIAELASELKKQNKTLVTRLNEIYDEFGYHQSKTLSYRFEGEDGFKKMQNILLKFRTNSPKQFADKKVIKVLDYETEIDDLPKANMIVFKLSDGAQIIVRPSGTEPLIKFYVSTSRTKDQNLKDFELLQNAIEKMI